MAESEQKGGRDVGSGPGPAPNIFKNDFISVDFSIF